MSPVPIEEDRFAAYINRPECPGAIAHLPSGQHSVFVATPAPFAPVLHSYKILLPYNWPDARRIQEVALYIAWLELRLWGYTPLDRLIQSQAVGRAEMATTQEIADRLIAPRPWVEALLPHPHPTRDAIRQAARSLSIPASSVRTVLAARDSLAADAVHQRVKEATGYPWFLPPDLRMRYPADRW